MSMCVCVCVCMSVYGCVCERRRAYLPVEVMELIHELHTVLGQLKDHRHGERNNFIWIDCSDRNELRISTELLIMP